MLNLSIEKLISDGDVSTTTFLFNTLISCLKDYNETEHIFTRMRFFED